MSDNKPKTFSTVGESEKPKQKAKAGGYRWFMRGFKSGLFLSALAAGGSLYLLSEMSKCDNCKCPDLLCKCED